MGQLQAQLIEQYAQQYARVNSSIDPTSLSGREGKRLDLMFGELIRGLPAGTPVLDAGCGTGKLLYWLSRQSNIVPAGVDLSTSQVEVARAALPKLCIHCEDAIDYMKRQHATYGAIFSFDVLEHMPSKDTCFVFAQAALQALRPGGFFICRVPNAANLTSSYSRYMDLTHEIIFTRTSLFQLLDAAGFADICTIPVKAAHFSGRVRLWGEGLLHRAIFRICGRSKEDVFTSNVQAIGYRR